MPLEMQTWDMFWVCVLQFLFWGLYSRLGTKWLPLAEFLGLSSLFQWFGSPPKCKRIMQILANHEKEPTVCKAGQTGLTGGNCNVDGCLCETIYSWEVTILACQTWRWSFYTSYLTIPLHEPSGSSTHFLPCCCSVANAPASFLSFKVLFERNSSIFLIS